MLKIKNLTAGIDDKNILNNINLNINSGEFHVIMGTNGTGKSTLGHILAGKDNYNVHSGDIIYKDKSILDLSPDERAHEGIFMSFQYPVSIPGVNTMHFLRTAVNSIRKSKNLDEIEPGDFIKLFKEKLELIGLKSEFSKRSVNDGFSGGEKKRFEIIQMLLLNPDLIILDETDSGLDIDAIRIVSNGINAFRNKNKSFILITHYNRILNYLKPDFVHVMLNGTIVKSGGKELAVELEEKGYEWIK
ncbi:MAG: Fe-S cluster assembly ATPase SufC [Candidatus Marinimicrobia bacterium]|nr:Fe-S cluster assembly ATPase SufC [Candidatus Neomarinimicrobiota bacterium]|tara:strand:+ start:3467 stop:4204 length:738 start_codon:yes stop_codon:yes gene_type:complete